MQQLSDDRLVEILNFSGCGAKAGDTLRLWLVFKGALPDSWNPACHGLAKSKSHHDPSLL